MTTSISSLIPAIALSGTPAARIWEVVPGALFNTGMDQVGQALGWSRMQLDAELYAQMGQGKRICLVLVDGLGKENLLARRGHAPFLGSHLSAVDLRCTIPSTTAASITSLLTGQLPGATSMLGYQVFDPQSGQDTNLINFDQAKVPAQLWQNQKTVFEAMSEHQAIATGPAKFIGTGLTQAALRGAQYRSGETLSERIDIAVSALRSGVDFVYIYWAQLDHIGHHHGWQSTQWTYELEELDQAMSALARRLPTDTLLLITGDHGMVDVGTRIDLSQLTGLGDQVVALAGEPRALHVHTQPGRAQDVAERWQNELADWAWIVAGDDLEELVGPRQRQYAMGDFVAFAKADHVLVHPYFHSEGAIALPGVHGSLTDLETSIPLVAELI